MGLLVWLGLRRPNQWERPTLLDSMLQSPLTFFAVKFYHVCLLLRGRPFRPPPNRDPIRVVCVSDTHDQEVHIPEGDILIHAGDLTNSGLAADIQKQLDWLKAQRHQVKIVVAGNHDSYFDPRSRLESDVHSSAALDLDGLVYLESDLTVQQVKGRSVSIFGVPDIPECGPPSFAFQYSPVNQPWFSKVPPETDILITHCPPADDEEAHHLDNDLGDPFLLREVWRVKPRLHVFGHVHWGAGKEPIYFDEMQRVYERLLSRPQRGFLWDLVPNPAWWDTLLIVAHGVHSLLWKWIMGGPGSNEGSLMVNAAQMVGSTGRVRSRAVVVDI
ncbi:putative rhamnogalacturonate lyase C [Escovopsis weberi]|uniref:Putative rhamnogalacturonate lyase C n=1 Tax=Escovopsis weberi TaxID=150374 RepID=A0A0M9VSY7_ESCWE|nr:putative rhamnogalacturonate lyase C [Escovopsis weberi]